MEVDYGILATGAVVVDAFAEPTVEVFVVVEGSVGLWNAADELAGLTVTARPGLLDGAGSPKGLL